LTDFFVKLIACPFRNLGKPGAHLFVLEHVTTYGLLLTNNFFKFCFS